MSIITSTCEDKFYYESSQLVVEISFFHNMGLHSFGPLTLINLTSLLILQHTGLPWSNFNTAALLYECCLLKLINPSMTPVDFLTSELDDLHERVTLAHCLVKFARDHSCLVSTTGVICSEWNIYTWSTEASVHFHGLLNILFVTALSFLIFSPPSIFSFHSCFQLSFSISLFCLCLFCSQKKTDFKQVQDEREALMCD